MYPSIIPPGARHVHPVNAAGHKDLNRLLIFGASASSILIDFRVRSGGTSEIQASQVSELPVPNFDQFEKLIIVNYLKLNGLTSSYSDIWNKVTGTNWSASQSIRNSRERQLAQIEIDVAVAIEFGITVDELSMIYRTQFPVMRRYDTEDRYDANGRRVPKEILTKWRKLGEPDSMEPDGLKWTHPQSARKYTFALPFRMLDREAEIRATYLRLERLKD